MQRTRLATVDQGDRGPPSNFDVPHPRGNGLLIQRRGRASLALLLEARQFAEELGRPHWDFAVEIACLRETGLTNSDLRWLVCKGYLEQANEVTASGDEGRVFEPSSALSFTAATCFVLTGAGVSFSRACSQLDANPDGCDSPMAIPVSATPHSVVPVWDAARQELRVGSVVVKQFKVPAYNQEMVLAAFEEEGWPVRIDDPLPPHAGQESKRRLHDTINSLNRNQRAPAIRFLGDGSGQGVRWKFVGSGAAQA